MEQHVRERTGQHGPRVRETRAHDPDGFFIDDTIRPDPLYMALRQMAATGWIAAIRRWIEARAVRREPASPAPLLPMPDGDIDQPIAA
jgi:hypothetical protein